MSTRSEWVAQKGARAFPVLLVALLITGASEGAPPPLRPERDQKPLPPRRRDPGEVPREEPTDGVLEIVPSTAPPVEVAPPPIVYGGPSDYGSKFERTLDLSLSPYVRWLRLPGTLAPSLDEEGRAGAGGVKVVGNVGETGFSIRGGGTIDGLRFGIGAGLSAPIGLRAERAGAGAGSIDAGKAFGSPVEAFLGYAHGSPRGVRPFVELRGSAALLHVTSSVGGAPRQTQTVIGPSIGGRLGALISINQYFFADVGLGIGFVGAERLMGSVGLGVPIPLANL